MSSYTYSTSTLHEEIDQCVPPKNNIHVAIYTSSIIFTLANAWSYLHEQELHIIFQFLSYTVELENLTNWESVYTQFKSGLLNRHCQKDMDILTNGY